MYLCLASTVHPNEFRFSIFFIYGTLLVRFVHTLIVWEEQHRRRGGRCCSVWVIFWLLGVVYYTYSADTNEYLPDWVLLYCHGWLLCCGSAAFYCSSGCVRTIFNAPSVLYVRTYVHVHIKVLCMFCSCRSCIGRQQRSVSSFRSTTCLAGILLVQYDKSILCRLFFPIYTPAYRQNLRFGLLTTT